MRGDEFVEGKNTVGAKLSVRIYQFPIFEAARILPISELQVRKSSCTRAAHWLLLATKTWGGQLAFESTRKAKQSAAHA